MAAAPARGGRVALRRALRAGPDAAAGQGAARPAPSEVLAPRDRPQAPPRPGKGPCPEPAQPPPAGLPRVPPRALAPEEQRPGPPPALSGPPEVRGRDTGRLR